VITDKSISFYNILVFFVLLWKLRKLDYVCVIWARFFYWPRSRNPQELSKFYRIGYFLPDTGLTPLKFTGYQIADWRPPMAPSCVFNRCVSCNVSKSYIILDMHVSAHVELSPFSLPSDMSVLDRLEVCSFSPVIGRYAISSQTQLRINIRLVCPVLTFLPSCVA